MKKIFLLAVLAAASIAADQPELPVGFTFKAPDDVADKLIAEGTARLATDEEPESDLPAPFAPPSGKTEKGAKPVRVRLLNDTPHGNANDVLELPAAVAKQLAADGQADTDKAAIAYALTLPQNNPAD